MKDGLLVKAFLGWKVQALGLKDMLLPCPQLWIHSPGFALVSSLEAVSFSSFILCFLAKFLVKFLTLSFLLSFFSHSLFLSPWLWFFLRPLACFAFWLVTVSDSHLAGQVPTH